MTAEADAILEGNDYFDCEPMSVRMHRRECVRIREENIAKRDDGWDGYHPCLKCEQGPEVANELEEQKKRKKRLFKKCREEGCPNEATLRNGRCGFCQSKIMRVRKKKGGGASARNQNLVERVRESMKGKEEESKAKSDKPDENVTEEEKPESKEENCIDFADPRIVVVDFNGYTDVLQYWEGQEYDRCRPLNLQIIYLLKRVMEREERIRKARASATHDMDKTTEEALAELEKTNE